MRHYIYFLSLLLLMAGCQSNKKHKETILDNNEETWTDEYTSDSQDAVWYNVQSDTIRCADGTVIYWHEQVQSSPFHRLTEMYRPANRLMAQTALQYGRATDQILLYANRYPWITSLYIDENYRGRNYGQLLMNHVIHRAQLLGYQTIYLAAGKTDYYRRQGWYELEQYLHQKANKVYYKNLIEQR